jgi:hypothetical protein
MLAGRAGFLTPPNKCDRQSQLWRKAAGNDRRAAKHRAMADQYTFGDIVRLIDGLAESTQVGFQRLEKRVDALTAEVRTGFGRLDEKFDRLETRVEALESQPEVR